MKESDYENSIEHGRQFFDKEDYKSALRYFTKACVIKPDNDMGWFLKGRTLNKLHKNREANECYNHVLESYPCCFNTLIEKGRALGTLGDDYAALGCFEIATELDPDHPRALHMKGIAHYSIGEYEKALACFEKIEQRFPKDHRRWKSLAYWKAETLKKLKKNKKALEINPRYDKIEEKIKNLQK